MAAEWWWWPLPGWMGSGLSWFIFLNVVVGAVLALSSRAQPPSSSPRRGGITRRASSAVLQRLRSFSIFSFPSSCFHAGPDAAATFQEAEDPRAASKQPWSPRVSPSAAAEQDDKEEEEEGDVSSMSMEEAYALALAGRQRPPPTEEEARTAEVDAKAEEFIRGFKEDLRQQRLNSIFNYTQMLKRRAGAGRAPGTTTNL